MPPYFPLLIDTQVHLVNVLVLLHTSTYIVIRCTTYPMPLYIAFEYDHKRKGPGNCMKP